MATLKAAVGDRVVLKVTNRLQQPVSLHFHGIPQHGSHTLFDGLDSSLQRPIKPNGEQAAELVAVPASISWCPWFMS